MAVVITLPSRLDIASCRAVLPDLVAQRAQAVELDGAAVSHIGAVGAQLLLSARASWGAEPGGLRVTGLAQSALKCLEDLGIAPDEIGAVAAGPAP